ncbi:MAG: CotH kinase family protein, partial [Lachnospiraceae bacterium]|nr:CotH kinase family protein [Lachnospiraceae bacterium]
TERFDGTYFANTYGVDKEDAVTVDIDELQGDDAWDIENFDRQSLIDYYAGNFIAAHNGDWPPFNIRFWKTLSDEGRPYGDAKLRPIIFDMNSKSMVDYDYDPFTYLQEWFYPFREMSGDPAFRQDLVDDIDKMRKNGFEPAKVSAYVDELYDRLLPQMILDKRRYSDCSAEEAKASFDKDVDVIRTFYGSRWEYLDKYKENYLDNHE